MTGGVRLDSPVEPRRVLLVGGGIAGVEALMALADLGDGRLEVHVVADHPSFVLRPQIVGEPWGGPPLHIDLARLCRAFGARFTTATVTGVDAAAHTVTTADDRTLGYERLLLAPGASSSIAYAGTRTLGFGALPDTLAADVPGDVAVLVPPGTSWTLPAYELALLVAAHGRRVCVHTPEKAPLEAFGPGSAEAVASMLTRHGVDVATGSALAPGAPVDELADAVLSLPLLHGPALRGLPTDPHGFVLVDAHQAVPGAEHVHAAGDATSGPVKQGGLAGQQADTAAAEIVRSCGGDALRIPYHPVLRGKLSAPDGEELYLRRALDGVDAGRTSDAPLWKPAGIVCAWRLAAWLNYRRDELDEYTLDHVARPTRA
jgi:sulfide:quinone oxidoreductase